MAAREAYNPLLKSYPDSRKVNSVSIGAETLFTRLIAAADDAGCYYGDPGVVVAKLYTRRLDAGQVNKELVGNWIEELKSVGLVVVYSNDGERYMQVFEPRRRLRGDVKPSYLFPQQNDVNSIIEPVEGHGTAHAKAEKPKVPVNHTVTSIDVAAESRSYDSGTSPSRNRKSPSRTYTSDPDPDPKRGFAAQNLSANADAPIRGEAELPPGFVRFWRAYPNGTRKQARGKCLATWRSRKLEKVVDAVLASLELCKRSHDWRKDGGAYVPMPMTWLNRAPWETDPGDLADEAKTKEEFGVGPRVVPPDGYFQKPKGDA